MNDNLQSEELNSYKEWDKFKGTKWKKNIDVANFIETNYKEYKGDSTFLKGFSKKTYKVWNKCLKLFSKESINGILDVETFILSGIDNFEIGYIDRNSEVISGLQTDEPLKRIINPYGDIKEVDKTLQIYGFHLDKELEEKFKDFRKTYSKAINDSYTPEIKKAIDNSLIVGLSDKCSRGYILGDYRRLALYGADYLIEKKRNDLDKLNEINDIGIIQLREDINEQIDALELIKKMANRYGFDVSKPASTAKEAIQWTYLAYLAVMKQTNGIVNPIGRNTSFFDIYIERDIENKILDEVTAQELIDQYIIKLRLIRHLRDAKYKEMFIDDKYFISESIGGMLNDEESLVTKTSYRIINSLYNLGEYQEPDLIILWSKKLPDNFKKYVSKVAIKKHSLQFKNDDLLRSIYGNDYAISFETPVKLGSQNIYYNGSINISKVLLYALNNGMDEVTGEKIIDGIDEIKGEYLNIEDILKQFDKVLKKTVKIYVDMANTIHYTYDKYMYENSSMAFSNSMPETFMKFDIAGLSTIVDSFSAIQFGHVRVKRDEKGIINAFDIEFDFPRYGNNDANVDTLACNLVKRISREFKKYPLYKNVQPIISFSSLVSSSYLGKNTGNTPDGRKKDMPIEVTASPSYGADKNGIAASMTSVAKLPYKEYSLGGITNVINIEPKAIGETEEERVLSLSEMIDGYFKKGGEHICINVVEKSILVDALNNPNKYLNENVGLNGYTVSFSKLTKEQKEEITSKTFHDKI